MSIDRERHRRRSIRLPGYDYARAGAYFVTLCVQGREALFGEIIDTEVDLNKAGLTMWSWWHQLPRAFPGVELDEMVVMPNHLHGIVIIGQVPLADEPMADEAAVQQGRHAGLPLRPDIAVDPHTPDTPNDAGRFTRPSGSPAASVGADLRVCPVSLPRLVQWFKTMSTTDYIKGVKLFDWPPFDKRLWQRNYYEHIVRNDADLARIRRYIADNPANWERDRENPRFGPGNPMIPRNR